MATKALPAAKVNPTKFLPSSTKKVSSANLIKMGKKDDESGELVVVHSKIIKIENLIKTNFKIEKDAANKERIRTEKQKKQTKEDELEKKPEGDEKPGKKISLPRLSFLEKIKNFLFKMILGFVAIKLLPHLPKLLKFLPVLAAATEFVLDWAGKILNAIVTVVDWGYKLYDTFRGLVKNIFGEKGLEKFDALSKALNTVLNASLIVAMTMARIAGGGFGRGAASGQVFKRGGQTLLAKKGGKLASTAAARKFALKHGRRAATRQVGSEGVKALGGKFARSQATNLARRGFMMVVGKQGAKNILRLVKPLVSKIPFIGGLLEFGLSWALGDPIGKAAFKGVGAGLGTWIGGLLGTLIPIPFVGTGIGMFLGGTGGSVLGDAIYNLIFGGKGKPSQPPTKVPDVEKMFGGGKTGRKLRTRSRRTSRKIRRSLPRVIPMPLAPGRDVGGEKKLDRMFPDTMNYQEFMNHGEDSAWWDPLGVFTGKKGKKTTSVSKAPMDPMGYIKDVYDKDTKTPFFGPLMGVTVKTLSGTKPSKIDYWNIGKGLNAWVYDMFGDVELGYAGGGEARANMLLDGRDLSSIIARSVEKSIDRTVEDTITDLRYQLSLGKMGGSDEAVRDKSRTDSMSRDLTGIDSPSGATSGHTSGTIGGQWGPVLDLISSVEGVSYDSVYPGTTKVKYSGGKPLYEMTIGEAHDWQTQTYRARGSAAAGKYQFMDIQTQAASYAGLGRGDMFSALNQDKMAIGLIEKKRKITLEMLKNNPAKAQRLLAMEWAGIPVGTAMRGHKRQVGPEQSYYAGDGRNASGTSTAAVRAAFAQVVGGGSGERTIERITGSDEGGDRPAGLEPDGGVGYGKMVTGPAGYDRIGAGAAYHVDTKFHKSLGMGNMISAMDKLAVAYGAKGREIVFSGQGYANLKGWNKDWDQKEKKKVLQSAIDAHSHSTFMRAQGFLPFDYYIPNKSANRDLYHKSTEGAEILLPTFGGKQKVGKLYGGYGKSADLFDSSGKHVAMTGHGDLAFSKGGYTKGYRHQAWLGERGKEFVMDADSTAALDNVFPNMLKQLNRGNYAQTVALLRSWAPYDLQAGQKVDLSDGDKEVIIAQGPKQIVHVPVVGGSGGSGDPMAALSMNQH